jgi:uncharacterized protein YkwD
MDPKVRTGIIAGLSVTGLAVSLVVALAIASRAKGPSVQRASVEPVSRPQPYVPEKRAIPEPPRQMPPNIEPERSQPPISDPVRPALPDPYRARPSLPDSIPGYVPKRSTADLTVPRSESPAGSSVPPTRSAPARAPQPPAEETVKAQPPVALNAVDQAFLDRLNAFRNLAGQRPVVVDPALSEGCVAHANYLVLHHGEITTAGLGVHSEKAGLAGFTEKGDTAAQRAVITEWGATLPTLPQRGWPITALDLWVSTLYHRVPILSANLKRVGIGYARNATATAWYVVMDVGADPEFASEDSLQPVKAVVYPGDGQSDLPRRFGWGIPELPNPLPTGSKPENSGYPITVTFPRGVRVTAVTATLILKPEQEDADAAPEAVPVWLSTPETPAASANQQNTICMIANKRLKAQTAYRITVRAKANGQKWQKTWVFTTGKS